MTHWGSLASKQPVEADTYPAVGGVCSVCSLDTQAMLIIRDVLQTLYLEKQRNVSSWRHRTHGRRKPSCKIDRSRPGEMAQQSGVHAALGENMNLIPSTYAVWLTVAVRQLWESGALFWLPQTPASLMCTLIIKNKACFKKIGSESGRHTNINIGTQGGQRKKTVVPQREHSNV